MQYTVYGSPFYNINVKSKACELYFADFFFNRKSWCLETLLCLHVVHHLHDTLQVIFHCKNVTLKGNTKTIFQNTKTTLH